MPPLTSFAATLPDDVLWDAGIVFVNGTTPFAATGPEGFRFDPAQTYQNLATDIPGVFYPVQGLDRLTPGVPKFTGTLVSINGGMLEELIPNVAITGTPPEYIATPPAAGDLLEDADYLTDVRVVYRRSSGGYVIVKFPVGLLILGEISGADKAKGSIPVTIEARQTAAQVATGAAPWILYISESASTGES